MDDIKKYKSELAFEDELIVYLTQIGGTKQWQYVPEIKTTAQLWANFRQILNQNNMDKLDGRPLTDTEFRAIKKVITHLDNPYQAGRFL